MRRFGGARASPVNHGGRLWGEDQVGLEGWQRRSAERAVRMRRMMGVRKGRKKSVILRRDEARPPDVSSRALHLPDPSSWVVPYFHVRKWNCLRCGDDPREVRTFDSFGSGGVKIRTLVPR